MGSIRRRLMTQRDSGNSGLPAGYYLCEYIEATGTQWIDTGIVPDNNTRMVLDFAVTNTTETTNNTAGTRNTTSSQAFAFSTLNGYWRFGYNTSSPSTTVAVDTERHIVDINKNVLSLDGNVIYTATAATFTGYSTIYLGAIKASSSGYVGYVKLYGCKIYDNGVLVRNFIPCYSPSHPSHFGMYDTVTQEFFGNAGSKEFQGKIVIPEDYTWLEYIYSGGNAYIDTGFKPNQSTRVVMDAQLVNANDVSKTICFFGVRGNNTYYEIYKASTGNWKLTYLYGTNTNQAFTIDYSTRHYIDYNKNTATIDWGTSLIYTAQTFQMIYNLFLGADNGSGSATAMAPMRIFHSAIWDNGEIIRLFVPCINKSGVYGLYDRVNDKFYSSAGTGQFGEEPVAYDFAYTGGEQTVTLKPGTYKLECWGAQGGLTVGRMSNANFAGGKGGYAVGVLSLANTANIYINVGGKGANGKIGFNTITPPAGGYNGGGAGGSSDRNAYMTFQTGAGGGGATHIGKSSGLLSAITDSDLLVAAGGGGGASGGAHYTPFEDEEGSTGMIENGSRGGAGGGESGILGNLGSGSTSGYQYGGYGGGGGTSTSGGYGGTKGSYINEGEDDATYSGGGGGGGGGGYYGGGGGAGGRAAYGDECKNGTYGSKGKGGDGGDPGINDGWWAGGGGGGGGGSAFAASSLTSVSLIAGNATMPSITGGTETGHAGNGYARITKIA